MTAFCHSNLVGLSHGFCQCRTGNVPAQPKPSPCWPKQQNPSESASSHPHVGLFTELHLNSFSWCVTCQWVNFCLLKVELNLVQCHQNFSRAVFFGSSFEKAPVSGPSAINDKVECESHLLQSFNDVWRKVDLLSDEAKERSAAQLGSETCDLAPSNETTKHDLTLQSERMGWWPRGCLNGQGILSLWMKMRHKKCQWIYPFLWSLWLLQQKSNNNENKHLWKLVLVFFGQFSIKQLHCCLSQHFTS